MARELLHHIPKALHDADKLLLITLICGMLGSFIGLASMDQFSQLLESLLVPLAANLATAWLIPRVPTVASLILPLFTVWCVMYIDNAATRVFAASAAMVGWNRAHAMMFNSKLSGGIGVRAVQLVMIPNFTSAISIPENVSLLSVYVGGVKRTVVSCAGTYLLYVSCKVAFGADVIQSSMLLSSGCLAVVATCSLYALDGLYTIAFAYPCRIQFTESIQNNPHLSLSIREFWGQRWNVSISRALRAGVFEPLHASGRFSKSFALMASFVMSGVVHAVQIAAWRAPTEDMVSAALFFVVQAPLIAVERAIGVHQWKSKTLRRLWTFGLLWVTSPLLMEPMRRIYQPWAS